MKIETINEQTVISLSEKESRHLLQDLQYLSVADTYEDTETLMQKLEDEIKKGE